MTEALAAHTVAAAPEAQIAEILLSQLASRLTHLFATLQLAGQRRSTARYSSRLTSR